VNRELLPIIVIRIQEQKVYLSYLSYKKKREKEKEKNEWW